MRRSVQGKRVLLTGASRGIGRRLAELLLARGAQVVVSARSPHELSTIAGATPIAADLTSAPDRGRLVADAVAKLGGLDLLVNCAGVCSFGEFATSSEAINRQVMELNFFAPVELTRLAMPHLKRGRQPAVVNVASIAGRVGIPSFTEHAASKHALVGMSEAWRAEFVRFEVDVLLALPGLVRTDDLSRHLLRNEGRIAIDYADGISPEDAATGVLGIIENNRTEAAVGRTAWWLRFGKMKWPRFVRWYFLRKARRFKSSP